MRPLGGATCLNVKLKLHANALYVGKGVLLIPTVGDMWFSAVVTSSNAVQTRVT